MFAATRMLIAARQPHTRFLVESWSVKKVGTGIAGDCFENATNAIDRSQNIQIVSGWIVGKFDPIKRSTEITAHFWNGRNNTEMFDLTPLSSNEFEYVVDMELNSYGQKNYDRYSSMVCSSLLLKDGKFTLVSGDRATGLRFSPAKDLSNEELFKARLIDGK